MAQNLKFKVKEFEWFEMETRVRQIIQQVLGPMQKRILQSSNTIHKLKINQAEDSDKLSQVTLMIANDPKVFETGIFHTVEQKFQEQSKHIVQLSRQITESSKYIDEKFKILDIRMEESSEVLHNVASLRQRISKEIELQNDNINHLRTNMEKMIDAINVDMREVRTTVQHNLQLCQKEQYLLNDQLKTLKAEFQEQAITIQTHRQLYRQKNNRLEQHSQQINTNTQQIQQLQQSKQLTKKLHQYVKHMQNQLKRAQFKMDNISPLITMAQVSEALYYVLPQKMRKRIAIHQYKKYYILNREVLQKQYNQVRNKFSGLSLLQQMQKRNSKEIVQLKRKKLLAMGIDIDHLTYEQRERHYNEVSFDEVADEEEDEVKVNTKVDEKQIAHQIEKHFKDFTNLVSDRINIQLQDAKKYMYGVEQQIKQQMHLASSKYDKLKSLNQTFQTQQLLQNKFMLNSIKEIESRVSQCRQQMQDVRAIQKIFYNFCSLINHLSIQDQIDKQNISLMGVQERGEREMNMENTEQRGVAQVVSLQRNCFSCCKYPATAMSAFKMACLAYNPSIIRIEDKEYKREELLEFTTNMLHSIKGSMEDTKKSMEDIKKSMEDTPNHYSLDSEPHHIQGDKKYSENKFRKTKKINCNYIVERSGGTRKKTRNNFFNKQDFANASSAFVQLRKKNLSFLS